MKITIEINGTFKSVESKNERGHILLSNFLDGVVETKELEYPQYENYLNITTLATLI